MKYDLFKPNDPGRQAIGPAEPFLTHGPKHGHPGMQLKAVPRALPQLLTLPLERGARLRSRGFKPGDDASAILRSYLRFLKDDAARCGSETALFYERSADTADETAFLNRFKADQAHIRLIFAPDDARRYPTLRAPVRALMSRLAADLGIEPDWLAMDHVGGPHPHTHITLRQPSHGRAPLLTEAYIANRLQRHADDIVKNDLGPRNRSEAEDDLSRDIEATGFTRIDAALIAILNTAQRTRAKAVPRKMSDAAQRTSTDNGVVRVPPDLEPFFQTLLHERLRYLGRIGVARCEDPDTWRLDPDLESILRRAAERQRIFRRMQGRLARRGLAHRITDLRIFDATLMQQAAFVGAVLDIGVADEIDDLHYLLLECLDGQICYVDIGANPVSRLRQGTVVRIVPKNVEPGRMDFTILQIAVAHNGRYSAALHRAHDPAVTVEHMEACYRHLYGMMSLTGGVAQDKNGDWLIGHTHLDRVRAYKRAKFAHKHLDVQILNVSSLAEWRELTNAADRQAQAFWAMEMDKILSRV